MRDTEQRKKSQALAVYLFLLKTGLDQHTMAALFEIESQRIVSRYLSQVRESLINNLVPKYLGINNFKNLNLK